MPLKNPNQSANAITESFRIHKTSSTNHLASVPLSSPRITSQRNIFHPAAKLRLNRVRALLGQSPVLTAAEMQAWNPPPEPDDEPLHDPTPSSPQPLGAAKPCADGSTLTRQLPQCPHCHKTMIRLGNWRTPQDLLGLLALWRTQHRPDAHPP